MTKIFIVTKQKSIFENIPVITPEKALSMLDKLKVISCDTENTGLDFMTKKILTIQTGNRDFQIVWDATTIDISILKDILKDRLTVWQYAIYDLPFLFNIGICPNNIWDCCIAEKLIYQGYDYDTIQRETMKFGNDFTPFSLKTEVKKYCNADLDKSVRGKINISGLNNETAEYAARDIEFEEDVMNYQRRIIYNMGMLPAVKVENNFTRCCAYMKWCGTRIDVDKWNMNLKNAKEKSVKIGNWINGRIIEEYKKSVEREGKEFVKKFNNIIIKEDKNLFYNGPEYRINISMNNIPEMTNIINMVVPEDKKEKVLKVYGIYTKLINEEGTYSDLTDKISLDGRIHIAYSGLSSVGRVYPEKDKYTKKSINLMSIPKEMRSSVIPEKGNVWISSDYSCQEMRIVAEEAAVLWMRKIFDDDKDLYCEVARGRDKKLKDISDKDMKEKYPEYRKNAKEDFITRIYGNQAVFRGYKKYLYLDDINDGRLILCKKTGFSGLCLPSDYNEAFSALMKGTGSTMLKIAYILFYNDIIKNNLFGKVLLTIPNHDEINAECPDDIKDKVKNMIINDMNISEKYLCPHVTPKVVVSISNQWN